VTTCFPQRIAGTDDGVHLNTTRARPFRRRLGDRGDFYHPWLAKAPTSAGSFVLRRLVYGISLGWREVSASWRILVTCSALNPLIRRRDTLE